MNRSTCINIILHWQVQHTSNNLPKPNLTISKWGRDEYAVFLGTKKDQQLFRGDTELAALQDAAGWAQDQKVEVTA